MYMNLRGVWTHPNGIEVSDKGTIDNNAKKAFTNGQCHALAAALHDLTGWPIFGLQDSSDCFPGGHVIVKSPKGFLDIGGLNAKDRWEEEWRKCELIPITRARISQGLPAYKKANVEAAIPFAKSLIKKYFKGKNVLVQKAKAGA